MNTTLRIRIGAGLLATLLYAQTLFAQNKIGINLRSPDDYGGERLYADVIRCSRMFKKPGTTTDAAVDALGWPLEDFEFVVWGDAFDMNGTYALSFTGQATISILVGNAVISNKTYDAVANKTTATLTYNGTGKSTLSLRFTGTSGAVKNLVMKRPKTVGGTTPYTYEDITTDFRNLAGKFSTLRLMDWTHTNSSEQTDWADRMPYKYASYQRRALKNGVSYIRGASWGFAIQVANAVMKDIWICIPAKATDDYVTQLATLLKNGDAAQGIPALNSALNVYVEYSNELWNTAGPFQQSKHNYDAAQASPAPMNYDGATGWTLAWRRVAKRGVDISTIFRTVWGDAAMMTRIRPVLMWQQNNGQGVAQQCLKFMLDNYPNPPSYYFYGGGGSAYYNPDNSSDALTLDNIWSSATFLTSNWTAPMAKDADLAAAMGLRRIAYEGGPSMDNLGHSESVKAAAVNDARMKTEVTEHHTIWNQYGGDLLCYFQSTGDYQWGFSSISTNLNTPKYQAIDALKAATPAPLNYASVPPFTRDGNQFNINIGGGTTPGAGARQMNTNESAYYTFRITTAGGYTINAQYANAAANSTIDFWVDGGRTKKSQVISGSGTTTTYSLGTLQPGLHSVRIRAKAGSFSLQRFSIGAGSGARLATAEELPQPLVYPNPTNGQFTVDLPQQAALSVFNAQGKLIGQFSAGKTHAIDLTQQPGGLYLLKAQSEDGRCCVTRKVVITH